MDHAKRGVGWQVRAGRDSPAGAVSASRVETDSDAAARRDDPAGGTGQPAARRPRGHGRGGLGPGGVREDDLLAEWERRDERPFAWLSLDQAENDPTVFLTYLAAALDRVQALEPAVLESLSRPRSSLQTNVARLGRALSSLRAPIVVALDDVHVLHWRASMHSRS